MRKRNFLVKQANSIAKRLFWRGHLLEAIQEIASLREELPTAEMLMTLPLVYRGKGFFRTLDLKQNMAELLKLVRLLDTRTLNAVCEIGTMKGGTLFIWCQLAAPEGRIYSIDLPGGPFGGGYAERSLPLFQSFCRPGQVLECLQGDSHNPDVQADFSSRLGDRQLDFLFIDGDHSYAGVKQDYLDYSPFVRPGGLIAFHDILRRDEEPSIEVWRLWEEIKMQQPSAMEFVDTESGCRKIGIGVITCP